MTNRQLNHTRSAIIERGYAEMLRSIGENRAAAAADDRAHREEVASRFYRRYPHSTRVVY